MNSGREQNADVKRVIMTSLSGMAAETTTFPIDFLKTRLQLHGESMQPIRHRSAYGIAFQIARQEGVLGMYKGLSPAILRHMMYTPIRIVGYEHLRDAFSKSPDNSMPFYSKAFIGGFTGVVAQVITSPADLIKVRMQADGRMMRQGIESRYSGMLDALNKIIRAEGLKGLWKGVTPNAQRAFLVNMGELACYDHAKRVVIDYHICNENIYAHTISSIISGLASTVLSCPADVVKTRMMNQGGDAIKYRSSYDCIVKTVRVEGFRALWKGFLPTWARLGPWQFVFWVSYEKFRHIAGLTSF